MLVLGIDPSLSSTGYAVLKAEQDKVDQVVPPKITTLFDQQKDYKPDLIDFGVIKTNSNNRTCERNFNIRNKARELITDYNPQILSCEDQYGYINADTLKKLSHVRGQFMTLAEELEIPFHLYTPRGSKKIITDNGNAKKQEVIDTINDYYDLDLGKSKDNQADAIALALSYLLNSNKGRKI